MNDECSVYMDHAATTPVSESVQKAMQPYFSEKFGNPSSIYRIGREAKADLWEAREKAAFLLGAERPTEIVFTSGATESNNLAIKGVAQAGSAAIGGVPHFITSQIEHHCVLDSIKYLEKTYGVEVTCLPVNKEGLIDPEAVRKSIRDNTVMISIMMGNNEVGMLEPIADIGKVVKKAKDERQKTNSKVPLVFHTDAVQAFQYFDCDVDKLGIDMLTLTAHKFYGPKGVGLLYVRNGTRFTPQQQGGAQERGLRAGTENVPYIIGMVQAMGDAAKSRKDSERHISELSDYLTGRILKEIPETELLGPKSVAKRLPHISSILFRRVEGESILINLDLADIAASSGSACTSGSLEASHVTRAMGYSDLEAHGAVRFSLGKLNKKEDIDKLMEILPGIIEKLRAMSPIK